MYDNTYIGIVSNNMALKGYEDHPVGTVVCMIIDDGSFDMYETIMRWKRQGLRVVNVDSNTAKSLYMSRISE